MGDKLPYGAMGAANPQGSRVGGIMTKTKPKPPALLVVVYSMLKQPSIHSARISVLIIRSGYSKNLPLSADCIEKQPKRNIMIADAFQIKTVTSAVG